MAFGFPPKHIQQYTPAVTDQQQLLPISIQVAKKLGWNLVTTNKNSFVAYTPLSWVSFSEDVTVTVNDGILTIRSKCKSTQIIDRGKNKKNVELFISTFEELITTSNPETVIEKPSSAEQTDLPQQEDAETVIQNEEKGMTADILSIFKVREGYFITPILLIINLLVFIAMIFSGVHIMNPENQDLLNWGANFRPLTLEGQWWRLFTACFIHIGILHLFMNLYALLFIGILLEPYLGKIRFLFAYLISGVAASLVSLWWHDFTISAGASGAIFGMYGVFIALLTTNIVDKSVRQGMMTSIGVFVVFNIFNGLKANSGIDNAAHIGGLLSGIVIGYALVPGLKKVKNIAMTLSTVGMLILLLGIGSFFVFRALPNDIGKYQIKINDFVTMEARALKLYELPAGTSNETIKIFIKDTGIYYWNESVKLIESFDELELSEPIRLRNAKLKEYLKLRIESYELMYRAYEDDTDVYNNEIKEFSEKILAKINEINEIE